VFRAVATLVALLSAYAVPLSAAVVAIIVAPVVWSWVCGLDVAAGLCAGFGVEAQIVLRVVAAVVAFALANRWLN
jgi:hypothetical protein